jgi:hypothetical protein
LWNEVKLLVFKLENHILMSKHMECDMSLRAFISCVAEEGTPSPCGVLCLVLWNVTYEPIADPIINHTFLICWSQNLQFCISEIIN